MSKEELSKCYGEEIVWHEISLLKENPSQHCNNNNNNNNNIIIMDMTSINFYVHSAMTERPKIIIKVQFIENKNFVKKLSTKV